MHKNLLTLIAAIVLCISITAVATAEDELNTGFGFAFGRTCGNGFSIRSLPAHGWGYQSGIIYFKSDADTYFNLGAELLYALNRTSTTALYLIAGLSYSAESHIQEDWNIMSNRWERHRVRESGIACGAGMGIAYNYARWERLWWSADLVIAAYHDSVLPYPQFGLHYLFK